MTTAEPTAAQIAAHYAADRRATVDGLALLREVRARYDHDPLFHHAVERAAASARALVRIERGEDPARLSAGIALTLGLGEGVTPGGELERAVSYAVHNLAGSLRSRFHDPHALARQLVQTLDALGYRVEAKPTDDDTEETPDR